VQKRVFGDRGPEGIVTFAKVIKGGHRLYVGGE
jgi:hypothetical protein